MTASVNPSVHPGKHSASTGTGMALCKHDREVLRSRGIPLEVALAHGLRTVTAAEAKAYGFPPLAGLLIPLYNTQGEISGYQLRPHEPPIDPETGKPRKYLFCAGQRMSVYVPPSSLPYLDNPAVPILATESAIKALAITAAIEPGTYCVIAVSGSYGWRSQDMPLSDHRDIPWHVKERGRVKRRRRVSILFDSDANTNPNVAAGRWQYGEFLGRRKASVRFVDVPLAADGSKQGIDDALAAGHDLEAMLATAYPAPEIMPTIGDTAPDDDRVPEIERLRHRVAELEHTQSALMRLIKNPHMGHKEKMLYANTVTLAAAKRQRGEIEPDGRVVLEPRHIANDHRPIPGPGESRLKANPLDGSKFLADRATVPRMMKQAKEAGLFDLEIRHVAKQGDDGRWAKYPEIVLNLPGTLPAALEPLAAYVPPEIKQREDYGQKPCPQCGEVHSRTRRTYCNGCGAETEPARILPAPEAQRADPTETETPAVAHREDAPQTSIRKNLMVNEPPTSDAPTDYYSRKNLMVKPEPETPAQPTIRKNLRVPIREELERRTSPAPPPPTPAGPLFDAAKKSREAPRTCYLCPTELPPDRHNLCEPCEAAWRRDDAHQRTRAS